jgi:hypothetical protein
MAKLDRDAHLDRYRDMRATLGDDIQGYALVAIDASGEVYWGANFSNEPRAQREIERWLEVMLYDVRQLTAKS